MNPTLKSVLEDKGTQVFKVSPESPVIEAAKIMASNQVGGVLVMKDAKICGILTERDLLNQVTAKCKDPEKTMVADVMSTTVATLGSGVTVREALKVATEQRKRHFPVVDEQKLLGLVSTGDLARWVVKDLQIEIDSLINYVRHG